VKVVQDYVAVNFQPSLRDLIMFRDVSRTIVLGLEFLHFSKAEAAPRSLAVLRF
jgi:hypothetical protein